MLAGPQASGEQHEVAPGGGEQHAQGERVDGRGGDAGRQQDHEVAGHVVEQVDAEPGRPQQREPGTRAPAPRRAASRASGIPTTRSTTAYCRTRNETPRSRPPPPSRPRAARAGARSAPPAT